MAVYFVYLAAVEMVGMLFWPAFVEHAAVAVLLFFGWWRAGLQEMPDGARGGLTC